MAIVNAKQLSKAQAWTIVIAVTALCAAGIWRLLS